MRIDVHVVFVIHGDSLAHPGDGLINGGEVVCNRSINGQECDPMDEEHDNEWPENPIQHGVPTGGTVLGCWHVGHPCVSERFCETRHALTLTNLVSRTPHLVPACCLRRSLRVSRLWLYSGLEGAMVSRLSTPLSAPFPRAFELFSCTRSTGPRLVCFLERKRRFTHPRRKELSCPGEYHRSSEKIGAR